MTDSWTDLIIIGAGAGGLMGAVTAGQAGVRCLLIERKPQPGRKLLMCANNRCNLTNDLSADQMLAAYGAPMNEFLRPAITACSPRGLCQWFAANGLKTRTHKDGKVFPHSEKSSDVVRFFSGCLRDYEVPVMYNGPVKAVKRLSAGFEVVSDNVSVKARHVLIATGGVSYPKTGSVGDGQKFAGSLGHKIIPYRPGLVGWEIAETWLCEGAKGAFPGTRVKLFHGDHLLGETSGEIEFSKQGLRGPAIVDASRILAKSPGETLILEIDLAPHVSVSDLSRELAKRGKQSIGGWRSVLSGWLLPATVAGAYLRHIPEREGVSPDLLARRLKRWCLTPVKSRPLKEAMVTIGGVSLSEVNPRTMESRLVPGLYFCGEVLDVDGPTGGFNLHAAFATATLAGRAIAEKCPLKKSNANARHRPGRGDRQSKKRFSSRGSGGSFRKRRK